MTHQDTEVLVLGAGIVGILSGAGVFLYCKIFTTSPYANIKKAI